MGKIIAFSGKATSGKTAAAKILQSRLGGLEKVQIISFASLIKMKAIEDFGEFFEPSDIIHNKGRAINIDGRQTTLRQLLIDIGRVYRELDRGFWLRKGMGKAKAAAKDGYTVIIDDMRFPNEYHALEQTGAVLVRIDRPGIQLIDDESEKALDSHPFVHKIDNSGTLEDLEYKLCGPLGLAAYAD